MVSEAELQTLYIMGALLNQLALNILGMIPGPLLEIENGMVYILVTSCNFTTILNDQTEQAVAVALINTFISRLGIPERIHTDQSRNFKSNLFYELCKRGERTTPCRPQFDG